MDETVLRVYENNLTLLVIIILQYLNIIQYIQNIFLLQRKYVAENEDARIERKLYVNFEKWLQKNYSGGKPSTEEWIAIAENSSSPKVIPPSQEDVLVPNSYTNYSPPLW